VAREYRQRLDRSRLDLRQRGGHGIAQVIDAAGDQILQRGRRPPISHMLHVYDLVAVRGRQRDALGAVHPDPPIFSTSNQPKMPVSDADREDLFRKFLQWQAREHR